MASGIPELKKRVKTPGYGLWRHKTELNCDVKVTWKLLNENIKIKNPSYVTSKHIISKLPNSGFLFSFFLF